MFKRILKECVGSGSGGKFPDPARRSRSQRIRIQVRNPAGLYVFYVCLSFLFALLLSPLPVLSLYLLDVPCMYVRPCLNYPVCMTLTEECQRHNHFFFWVGGTKDQLPNLKPLKQKGKIIHTPDSKIAKSAYKQTLTNQT